MVVEDNIVFSSSIIEGLKIFIMLLLPSYSTYNDIINICERVREFLLNYPVNRLLEYTNTCDECFGRYLAPTIYVGSLLKRKRFKTTRTKGHSKQSSPIKIKFIFQQIHKKETLQNITNILI